jgi:hypothetical protein
MGKEFVTVTLRREIAEELVNAHVIALGAISSKKGKGKKKDGGGKKYGGTKKYGKGGKP